MKFSSFLLFTAAGLAIAAPITPISPSNTDKKLTIEPVAVAKRATPDVSSLTALTGAVPGGLPVKRQLGGLLPTSSSKEDGSESPELEEPKAPKEPKEPSSVTDGTTEIDDGTAAPSTNSATSALSGLPIGKRQLGGLLPSSSSKEDGSESPELEEPKAPKEPKEPSSVADGTTEIDDGTKAPSTNSATSALSGLPIGKRQIDGLTGGLLGGDESDAAEPAAGEEEEPKEGEEPVEGEDAPAEGEEAPVDAEDPPAEGEEPAPPAEDSGLGGILKRQGLGGLTSGLFPTPDAEPAAEDAEGDADTTIKSQTSRPDDGTNGANSFDAEPEETAEKPAEDEAAPAEEKTAEEAAPAKNATEPAPAKTEKAGGLLGSLGM